MNKKITKLVLSGIVVILTGVLSLNNSKSIRDMRDYSSKTIEEIQFYSPSTDSSFHANIESMIFKETNIIYNGRRGLGKIEDYQSKKPYIMWYYPKLDSLGKTI